MMAHMECLELSGRLLRIQHSKRMFALVYVNGILGKKVDPSDTDSKGYS